MSEQNPIKVAEFNPRVCTYWLLYGAILFTVTVVGIPLLILWFPLGLFFTRRYLARMECVLTEKELKVRKGVMVRVEKTIPLEKITDMGVVQGPIMRYFDLHRLTVETAGQSGAGALVSLTGIVDAKEFRELVLKQREVVARSASVGSADSTQAGSQGSDALLSEIRDSLHRIESLLDKSNGSSP